MNVTYDGSEQHVVRISGRTTDGLFDEACKK